MRVSENRYSRDLRKLNLAKRCIELGLRTYWILLFTGMTEDQLRNLLRSYFGGPVMQRHRGNPPTSFSKLFRPTYRGEASALAGMVKVLRLVPETAVRSVRDLLPDIGWGERLCEVFELFHLAAPGAVMSMDLMMLIVSALAEGRLTLGRCMKCQGVILVDPLANRRPVCEACECYRAWEKGRAALVPRVKDPQAGLTAPAEWAEEQQNLF